MKRRRSPRPFLAALLVLTVVAGAGTPTEAAPPDPGAPGTTSTPGTSSAPGSSSAAGAPEMAGGMSAAPVGEPARIAGGAKALTSRIARTDESLLSRRDAQPVPVMVKLDYDPLATYSGEVGGLAATSPSVTGRRLSGSSAERRYDSYLRGRETTFVDELRRSVPDAVVGQRLRTVYGGVAATVPANRVADIAKLPGVVAVQSDKPNRPLTDSSPQFIGATDLYPRMGGTATSGRGVIVAVLDTGAWPEHPSFADQGQLRVPPAKPDGTPRKCDFGDDPTKPGTKPFRCNRKLIGGAAFLKTYLADPSRAKAEKYHTARDSDGHGTHTGSTAVGNVVSPARVLGVDRGPINGMAPGAWLSVYKVCGASGCFPSDAAAAVAQAVKDGVQVINFSVSGGAQPDVDPVELAFLDAYAAGVFVAAAAGNDGPTAGTVQHLSPWVTTVAASTQRREFSSTLRLRSSDGTSATLSGATITRGLSARPVVVAADPPYSSKLCDKVATKNQFTGKIVVCERGTNARVTKGYNVKQGGAAGMILYNPSLADVETDNHWLPAVHLAEGTALLAFLTAHKGVTAEFSDGRRTDGRADVLAAFSSRGPAGTLVKPDITAPGVQILAGHTPVPDAVEEGPPGEYFQSIAGTSMAAPHIAGAAALLRSLHPNWTPGQVKSAMMTTAVTKIVAENLKTAATPFEVGAGRINVAAAADPGLTLDETAARMTATRHDPVGTVQLNLPSVDAPVMPGRLDAVRTVTNVSGRSLTYTASGSGPKGTAITVSPARFTVAAGKSRKLTITIRSAAPAGQVFGQVRLVPARGSGVPALHLPVAFIPKQGEVSLTSTCTPDVVAVGAQSRCLVTARNGAYGPTTVTLTSRVNANLAVAGASAGTVTGSTVRLPSTTLAGITPSRPSIAPGSNSLGYTPLGQLGIKPNKIGDEEMLNFDTPAFAYGGQTYTRIGVDSNGYVVVGGGTAEDNSCCTQRMPSPSRPNNMLAPFWTDLDGTGMPGVSVAVVTAGTTRWVVVQWEVKVFGTSSERHFQVWLGITGTADGASSPTKLREAVQDIVFAYDKTALPAKPKDLGFLVGAENVIGSAAATLGRNVLPTRDLRVSGTAPLPGGSVSYTVRVRGTAAGAGRVTTQMSTPAVPGVTEVATPVRVRPPTP
jgi:subtilisin family serine protease